MEQDGHYLEVGDLLLYALAHGVDLHIFLNTGNPDVGTISLEECVTRFVPDLQLSDLSTTGFSSESSKKAGRRWTVVLTRADFRPTESVQEFNHWFPAFPAEDVGDLAQFVAQEVCQTKPKQAEVAHWLEHNPEHYRLLRDKHTNFHDLLCRLQSLGLGGREVPADGNCGVWALLSLMEGPGRAHNTDAWGQVKMRGLRKEISSMWSIASASQAWQKFFDSIMPGSAGKHPSGEVKKEQSEVKQEESDLSECADKRTPTKKRKQDWNELLKAVSPPKLDKSSRKRTAAGLVKPVDADDDSIKQLVETSLQQMKSKPDDPDVSKRKQARRKERKARSDKFIAEQTSKTYLGGLGLTYGAWKRAHFTAKGAVKATQVVCSLGGFVALRQRLIEDRLPDSDATNFCSVCSHLLEEHGVSMQALQDALGRARAANRAKRMPDKEDQVGTADGAVKEEDDEDDEDVKPSIDVKQSIDSIDVKQEVKEEDEEASEDDLQIVAVSDVRATATKNSKKVKKTQEKKRQRNHSIPIGPSVPVMELVRQKKTLYQELPRGTEKKMIPILCLACTAASRRRHVFDLITLGKRGCQTFYLDQHERSSKHQNALRSFQDDQHGAQDAARAPNILNAVETVEIVESGETVPCEGFSPKAFPTCRLARMHVEMQLYLAHCNLTSFPAKQEGRGDREGENEDNEENELIGRNHSYIQDFSQHKLTIFHRKCVKTILLPKRMAHLTSEERKAYALCGHCRSLATDKSLVRNVARFYVKHVAAHLLKARLYKHQPVDELEAQIRGSSVFSVCEGARTELEAVLKLDVKQLQRFVRASFLSLPASRNSEACKYLLATVVHPSLQVLGAEVPSDMLGKAEIIARELAQGTLKNVSDVDLKLASYVAAGCLRESPMVHGILVGVVEKIRRQERGVSTLRNLQISDSEKFLLAEAGVALSAASCNKFLLQEFGVLHAVKSVDLQRLHDLGLPDAFLALDNDQTLKANGFHVDNAFCRHQQCPHRRLHLSFDSTYLLKQVNIMKCRLGKGFVGQCWRSNDSNQTADACKDAVKRCCVPVEEMEHFLDIDDPDHAQEMLVALVWDPNSQAKGLPRFPVLELPKASEASKQDMLDIMGRVMVNAGASVRSLCFDNHGSHGLVKDCLLGKHAAHPDTPFWGQVQYEPLPPTAILNLLCRIPKFDKEPIYALNGPLHLAKNIWGQMRSHSRTIMFGSFAVDMAGARDLGMPPGPYNGVDAQSDVHCALYMNPYYLVEDDENPRVAWSLRGSLLMNLLAGLLHSSVMHRQMTVSQRCENAMSAHVLLDLAKILSLEHEDELGLPRGSSFISQITKKNLQELASFVVIQALSLVPGYVWTPWRMTELPLEQWFGALRGRFATSQMSVRDFVLASAGTSRRFLQKMERDEKAKTLPDPPDKNMALTEGEFQACADRAFAASVKLMHLCLGYSETQIRRSYVAFCMNVASSGLGEVPWMPFARLSLFLVDGGFSVRVLYFLNFFGPQPPPGIWDSKAWSL